VRFATVNADVRLDLPDSSNDQVVEGSADVRISLTIVTTPPGQSCAFTPANRTASGSSVVTRNGPITITLVASFFDIAFTGTRNGNQISGTAAITYVLDGTGTSAQHASVPLVLTKQ
jgi:hypothetical protein